MPITPITPSTPAGLLPTPPDLLSDLLPNDDGNARRLCSLYSSALRYCPALKRWLFWDSRRWALDSADHAHAFSYARDTLHAYYAQANSASNDAAKDHACHSLSARGIRDLLSLAQGDLTLPAESLDTHPDLLNFTNGTLDLSTGVLRSHSPSDYLTKLIHHAYNPASVCPRWLWFLDIVLAEDADMIIYLQTALGYSLTGRTSSKATFILHGPKGNNGKSTLLSTFRSLIPEYSAVILVDSLISHKSDSTSTNADIADLKGVRFVQTSESQKGATLSSATLKRLSQGMGDIRARRLYQNPITFRESHKLWIDTNHQPELSDSEDSAVFARLHPIRFDVEIALEDQDPMLHSKMLKEAEGILAWTVEGALRWYSAGRLLRRPYAVEHEVERWRRRVDWADRFADDCLHIASHPSLLQIWTVESGVLYRRYKDWAEDGNDTAIRSHREFTQRMKRFPTIEYARTSDQRFWRGVKIIRRGRVGMTSAEQGDGENN